MSARDWNPIGRARWAFASISAAIALLSIATATASAASPDPIVRISKGPLNHYAQNNWTQPRGSVSLTLPVYYDNVGTANGIATYSHPGLLIVYYDVCDQMAGDGSTFQAQVNEVWGHANGPDTTRTGPWQSGKSTGGCNSWYRAAHDAGPDSYLKAVKVVEDSPGKNGTWIGSGGRTQHTISIAYSFTRPIFD